MTVKESLFRLLKESGSNEFSGQKLARDLGMSRAAVWKAVEELRAEGCEITGGSNRGYKLVSTGDALLPETVRFFLKSGDDRPITVLETTDSTNNFAKKLAADGARDGSVIIAKEQTAGRGRRGHSFFSPAGTALYMSVIYRPENYRLGTELFTICAGCAVCEAIESLTGKKPLIKWVNDIFLDGKKICGILSESTLDLEGGTINNVVVGIGINISTENFPEDISDKAGNLGCAVSRAELAARVIDRMEDFLNRPRGEIISFYKSRSFVLGKTVSCERNGRVIAGKAADINESGALVLETDEGEIDLVAGEISLNI